MKRAIINFKFYVDDSFKKGDCEHCPYCDTKKKRTIQCLLGKKAFDCPIYIHTPSQYEELYS